MENGPRSAAGLGNCQESGEKFSGGKVGDSFPHVPGLSDPDSAQRSRNSARLSFMSGRLWPKNGWDSLCGGGERGKRMMVIIGEDGDGDNYERERETAPPSSSDGEGGALVIWPGLSLGD
jgi:hypothetical protein